MNIAVTKTELLAGHPLTGAYNDDNQLAADEMNAVNRPTEGGVTAMLNYVVRNRSRTNVGTDLTATAIYGRLYAVANGTVGLDPFGVGAGAELTMEHIHSARNFLVLLSSPSIDTMDFLNTEVIAMLEILSGGAGNARVWKQGDVDALKALSTNQQSRATELGLSKRFLGHIENARNF